MLLRLAVLRMHPWELGPAGVSSRPAAPGRAAWFLRCCEPGSRVPACSDQRFLDGQHLPAPGDGNKPSPLMPRAPAALPPLKCLPRFYPVTLKGVIHKARVRSPNWCQPQPWQMLWAFSVFRSFWPAFLGTAAVPAPGSHSRALLQLGVERAGQE